MGEILVCDWGTSSFRLMRVSASGEILAQVATDQGVKQLNPEDMEAYLKAQMATLGSTTAPVVLCGMVGSGIGWYEVPYVSCPASVKSLSAALVRIPQTDLNAWCVPGVKLTSSQGDADVMRGEETQIIGWLTQASEQERTNSTLCLPGTHSKWAHVEGAEICEFSTAFTGEMYALLNDHSVLVQGAQVACDSAFDAGLAASTDGAGLIHQLFNARSRSVLGLQPASASASYLSGLLIGSEVAGVAKKLSPGAVVHLICGDYLAEPYLKALTHFGLRGMHYSGSTYSALGLRAIAEARGLM
ncbi:2-dehydro-3-deoxygalactonokinase [Microbulbifer agarilyticus]|uniref:2-dehydro-3-deoxygalactonokinase n=1 Tax=Microbulbifer agarilyticus TaxID=260552 RepID=UPI001C93A5D0|nr:2-dehydro-3-deoxygalactonokinase [Microbulbifer agarilyticus]MBY6188951.1 2-dehydro-3-deoxygalactonokinase [Microbulbifer agarilyticus]